MIERRRMQNINSGFTSLKRLLPPTEKKQTKAAVLQQAVQHILRLQKTVVQVKETNNTLRQCLADERKQLLSLKKEREVQVGKKLKSTEFQEAPFFSHIKFKGRALSPQHEVHKDRPFNRWPTLPCRRMLVSPASADQVFDRFSLHESKRPGHVPVIVKRQGSWESKNNEEGCSNQDHAPVYQQLSGTALSRDIAPEPEVSQGSSLGNNLQCIVDAINLLEKNWVLHDDERAQII